jgi:hypothetical protein
MNYHTMNSADLKSLIANLRNEMPLVQEVSELITLCNTLKAALEAYRNLGNYEL